MKKSVVASVLLSGFLASAASAAELEVAPRAYAPPPPPPPRVWSWSGFYMGVNGGYGSAGDDYTQSLVVFPAPINTFNSFGNNSINPKGGVFGGQAGFNFQTGPVVWGVEGDLQWASQSATACGHLCLNAPGTTLGTAVYQKIKWFNTARARVGYTNGPALIYATAGAAWAGIEETDTLTTSPPAVTQSQQFSNKVGGVAYGAGVEVRLMWGWTGKLEYLHLDLGGTTTTVALLPPIVPAGSSLSTTTGRIRDDIIRVGLNWQFGLMGQTGWGY
jgi:outer membrane immunogenic protein